MAEICRNAVATPVAALVATPVATPVQPLSNGVATLPHTPYGVAPALGGGAHA